MIRSSMLPCLPSAAVGRLSLIASLCGLLLSGCGITSWFDSDDKVQLSGKRVSVLQLDRKIEPDANLQGRPLALPAPARNPAWPQAGGFADHAMGNLSLASDIHEAWRADIGSGSGSGARLVSRPIIADGKVFTIDSDSEVSAFEAASGHRVWRVSLRPESANGDVLGGGISYDQGKLYAGTGDAEVMALDAANGTILWRKHLPAPVRGAPTVYNGRIFLLTRDNQTVAVSAQDGAPLWDHTGILETAGLLGSVSPAAEGNIVISAYSSGELFALRIENGRPAWSDNLVAIRRAGALSSLADIRGLPVIDHGQVLAISHSGRMVAIDFRTGSRIWEQELGGVDTPWPAGDTVFVLTNENEVIALDRASGRIRWVTPLERYVDPKDRSEPVVWSGPVLGGERLWLTGSTRTLISLSAQNGEILSRQRTPGQVLLAPVIADATLYVLTDDASLVAYR